MGVTRARSRGFGFCWLALLACLSQGVWAADLDELWWVVLGSYRNAGLAERRQAELEGQLVDVLSVVRAERDDRPLFRIVAGPFTDLEAARREVAEAAKAGVADAWVTRLGDGTYEDIAPELDALEPLPGTGRLGGTLDGDTPDDTSDETPATVPLDFNEDRETGFNKLFREGMRHLVDPLVGEAAGGVPPRDISRGGDGGRAALDVPWRDHKRADIRIDGVLDEAVWAEVPSYSGFLVIDPPSLEEPEYETILRFFYTDRGLYLGADAKQPPETLIARLSSRDTRRINRDSISLTLDTSGEGRYGYWFSVNLGGTLSDGTVLPERRFSNRWDGPWRGQSARTADGWSAEFFLPWSMMAMPTTSGPRKMGFYVSRKVAHRDERLAVPALARTKPQFMSALQPIRLEHVQPERQLEFYPFVSATSDRTRNDDDATAGLDVFWRPSTNLQVSATLNPDFGTVESDDVVVNLTAFETFFPEKRAFFLEGQEIFVSSPRADTDRRNPTTLLNTRRIGAPLPAPELPPGAEFDAIELGKPTELYGAAKVTGQFGGFRYGVLGALEKDNFYEGKMRLSDGRFAAFDLQQAGRQFAVVRGLYEASDQRGYRAVGAMSTATLHDTGDAFVTGLDWHYLSSSGVWKWDGQFMVSDTEAEGTGFGTFADLEYTPRPGRLHRLEMDYFDQDLDLNDLGFLRRNDVIGFRYNYQLTRTGGQRVRERRTTFAVQQEFNHRGHLTSSRFSAEREWLFTNLSRVRAEYTYVQPRWEDRNSQGHGEYRIEERNFIGLRYESDRSKPVSYALRGVWREEDLGGQQFQSVGQVSVRPIDRFALNVEVSHRSRNGWLVYQEGRNLTTFEAEEWRPKVDMDFFVSARQQLRLSLQWTGIKAFEDQLYEVPPSEGRLVRHVRAPNEPSDDFAVSRMTMQVRYRWEIAPLSDLFVVYTRSGDDSALLGESFTDGFVDTFSSPAAEQLIVKLRYRFGV